MAWYTYSAAHAAHEQKGKSVDGVDSILGGVADLLRNFDTDEFTDGDFDEVVHRLHQVNQVLDQVMRVSTALRLQVADLMPANEIPVEGIGMVRKTRSRRSTWRDQQASRAMRNDIGVAVAKTVGMDAFTGAINDERRNAALEAVKTVWEIIPAPSGMKQSAQAFGLDNEDYRATTWVNGIEIVPFPVGVES